MASAGSIYFIDKYSLARNGVAVLKVPPCSHQEEFYNSLISTPYRSVYATKAAAEDLKKLLKVNKKEVKRVEEFLKKRREDFERTQTAMRDKGAVGQKNDWRNVAPRTRIILRHKNSTLTPPRLPRGGPPRGIHPNPAPPASPASPAPVEPPTLQKRKIGGFFGLEPASKRPHLGCCGPVSDHVAAKPFRADDYDYETPSSTSIPKSQQTDGPEIPAKRAKTRRMTAKGAKLHDPEGDNFNRDELLQRNLPTCGPISSAKNSEIRSDLEAIATRKKVEEMYQPLREELKALARHYDCEEAPNRVYWEVIAGKKEKEEMEAMKRNEGEAKRWFNSELTFYRQNKAHEQRWERLVANLVRNENAMTTELNTNNTTPAITGLVQVANEASEKITESQSRWENCNKEGPVQDPAKKSVNALLAFHRQIIIHQHHFKKLGANASQKTAALILERNRNGLGPHLDDPILETDAAWKEVEEFQVWRQNWMKEQLPQILKLQVQAKIEEARARDPNSYKRDRQRDQCAKYRVAHKCAELAKQNIEMKEKLKAMAREIDTINQKIGPDVNGYHLNAIPVHMRVLGKSKTNHREMWTGLHKSVRIDRQVMKSNRLRYELGTNLEPKADEVLAKAAIEAAEEGLRLRQARTNMKSVRH